MKHSQILAVLLLGTVLTEVFAQDTSHEPNLDPKGENRAEGKVSPKETIPSKVFKPRSHGEEATAAGLNPKVLEEIDVLLQKHVEEKHISGVVALIARNDEVGYFEAFGMRDLEAESSMNQDAIFRIYSMTKPIVAVAAMSLWEEGKFKLDDPISKHLPEWESPVVKENGKNVPAENPITPRQLMTHSSGVSYSVPGLKHDSKRTLAEFSEFVAEKPLNFQPGAEYRYGYSIDLLGRYLEAVADQPLEVILQERILDPLGMKDSGFWIVDSKNKDRIAQMYKQPKPGVLKRGLSVDDLLKKPAAMLGGQGMVSTTEDYARFCHMLLNKGELNGKRVLKEETVAVMFKNHLKEIGQVYGLGAAVDEKGGYSWGGAAGTKYWVNQQNGTYAVFMVQTEFYDTPTFGAFKKLVEKALAKENAE